jgi:hypothetical protein
MVYHWWIPTIDPLIDHDIWEKIRSHLLVNTIGIRSSTLLNPSGKNMSHWSEKFQAELLLAIGMIPR